MAALCSFFKGATQTNRLAGHKLASSLWRLAQMGNSRSQLQFQAFLPPPIVLQSPLALGVGYMWYGLEKLVRKRRYTCRVAAWCLIWEVARKQCAAISTT
jgi:hypothetical protein